MITRFDNRFICYNNDNENCFSDLDNLVNIDGFNNFNDFKNSFKGNNNDNNASENHIDDNIQYK